MRNYLSKELGAALLLLWAFAGLAQMPPANDAFANSQPLSGTNLTVYCTNTFATLEPGETPPAATSAGKTLWYSWAAPFSGKVSIKHGPGISVFLDTAVYTGPDLAHLARVVYGRDGCQFMANEGTVYYLQIDGADGVAGEPNFTLTATPFLPATNDYFTNAIVLKGTSAASVMAFTGATAELGEPPHLGGQPFKSLWWTWQAPMNANASFYTQFSLATNITLAVYTGDSIESLSLVAKAVNWVLFPVIGGTTYHIAGVVSPDTPGDISLQGGGPAFYTATIPVPGNLLQEWSFENTGLNLVHWDLNGSLGGFVNESGGADGTTWPILVDGTTLSQDFPTVPGRNYRIRFAYSGALALEWDSNDLGVVQVPADEGGYWHWATFTAVASNTTSRISFVARGNASLDAVSVVWMNEPPSFVRQPESISAVLGGTAVFVAGAKGSAPLSYQWHFQNANVPGATNDILQLPAVTAGQAGQYFLVVTNAFGSVTSSPAVLVLDAPLSPTLVVQPCGDAVALGSSFTLRVTALGTPPLYYQWYLEGAPLVEATNRQLIFTSFDRTNAGIYSVKVWNAGASVWSLPASLRVGETNSGGGVVLLANEFVDGPRTNQAPVFDVDGITKLNGSDYVAQLYAGPVLARLRPAGTPSPFGSGFNSGYCQPQTVILPAVAPRSNAVVQVRVWQAGKGASYEEARALGGKFGRSEVLQVLAGDSTNSPQCLTGLRSFSLQAGLPQFTAGRIEPAGHQPDGTPLWSLVGNAGYLYSIERAAADYIWEPWLCLTNTTGTTAFTDPAPPPGGVVFYRARILE